MIQRHGVQQIGFGLGVGQRLINGNQIGAHPVRLLEQRHIVGAQKRLDLGIAFLHLRLQPQHLFGHARDGCIRGARRHGLFQLNIFLHARLQVSLGVIRIFPGGAQHENRGLGNDADI